MDDIGLLRKARQSETDRRLPQNGQQEVKQIRPFAGTTLSLITSGMHPIIVRLAECVLTDNQCDHP